MSSDERDRAEAETIRSEKPSTRQENRADVIARIRQRWQRFAAPSAEQVDRWIDRGW